MKIVRPHEIHEALSAVLGAAQADGVVELRLASRGRVVVHCQLLAFALLMVRQGAWCGGGWQEK